MYETHFGLQRRPFRPTPDGDAYYPATGHESALARIRQALDEDEGLMLLTGAPGTGKTLLCHRLLELIGAQTACAFLTNTHLRDRAALLQAILYDLSLPYEGKTEQELRLALTDFLLQNFAAGRRGLLLIDEAQHLTPDLLEELRLLGNLEARQGKAVQVLLVAQPGIEDLLCRPELSACAQRLALRVPLEPLDVHESADFLFHQLRMAGGKPERMLSAEAVDLLARAAHGVPRILNQVAHHALALACEAGNACVDAEAALETLARLGLETEEASAEESVPTDSVLAMGEAEDETDSAVTAGLLSVPPSRPA